MSNWAPEHLAYLAGVIDGEGSFVLHFHARRQRMSGQLQIGNTDLRLLEWIRVRFGGSVRLERRENPAHKLVWRWIGHSEDLTELITAVLPYLVAKREQAELFLAYRATLPPMIWDKRSTARTDPAVRQRRLVIREQLMALNRRGTGT